MRLRHAAFALLFALPLVADTYPRPRGFTAVHYDFSVTLSDADNALAMHEVATVRLTADNVGQVALDLCQLRTAAEPASFSNPCLVRPPYGTRGTLAATSPAGRGMEVTSASIAGASVPFHQRNDQVVFDLPRPNHTGQEIAITLDYHGTPANGLLIGNNKYGDREFFTNAWPDLARNWLAVVDHPSDKATKVMRVTAPRKYQVISNGLKTEEDDLPGDLRQTVWREDTPICTWQFSLGAAPFAVDYFGRYHGIQLSAWVFPQERVPGFQAYSAWTQPILEFYIDHIGPYAYEKLAQVEANGTGGGMELASDIYYGYRGDAPGRQLLAHEMAHQWFGDAVTENDWDDVWLSEGFATYFALLYTEHQDGRDAFVQGALQSAASARRYATAHPDSTVVHNNLSDISQVIANNAQIYQEGAQVLHMLRGVIGTDNFWKGIRLYYRTYRNRNATSLDFEHAMEQASGRDLSWYFQEWLHRGGIMRVSGTWKYDAAAKQLELDLRQSGTPRRMPVEVAGTTVTVEGASQILRIPMATAPSAVVLDPQHWVTMAEFNLQPAGQ